MTLVLLRYINGCNYAATGGHLVSGAYYNFNAAIFLLLGYRRRPVTSFVKDGPQQATKSGPPCTDDPNLTTSGHVVFVL